MISYNKFSTMSGGGVSGSGTNPYIPIWTNPTTLGDSSLYQPLSNQLYADNIDWIKIENTDPAITTYYNSAAIITPNSQASWEYYTQGTLGDVYGYIGWYGDDFSVGGSMNFYINCYASQSGQNTRYVDFFCNGNAFIKYEQYNCKTYLNTINYAQVPLNEDMFNVFIGGLNNYGFGGGGTTGSNKFFGNAWMQGEYYMATTYTFANNNVLSNNYSQNIFQIQGGNFILTQTTKLNTISCFTAENTFRIGTNGNITDISGLHIKGLKTIFQNGANVVGITNYYGILISDSNENNVIGSSVNLSNRYGIVQQGVNDINLFYGVFRTFNNIGFYGVTPVVQQSNVIAGAARIAVGGANVQADDTFGGYTIGQIVTALKNYGLLN